jgi:ribosomal protein L30
MSYFRITLHRSAIGMPKRTRGVLAALGLHRRSQVVFHPVSAQCAGMIMKVKELVRVDEVERPLTKAEVKAERTPDPGFYVERAVPRMADPTISPSSAISAAVKELGRVQSQGQGGQEEGIELRL